MANDFIMQLIQKKLLDKNYQITQEEVERCTDSLADRVYLANLLITMLNDEQKILNEFIEDWKKRSGST